jgi:hypothetical protein
MSATIKIEYFLLVTDKLDRLEKSKLVSID